MVNNIELAPKMFVRAQNTSGKQVRASSENSRPAESTRVHARRPLNWTTGGGRWLRWLEAIPVAVSPRKLAASQYAIAANEKWEDAMRPGGELSEPE